MQFFTEMEKVIINFLRKNKKPRIAKNTVNNKVSYGGITISGLKLYYKALEIKTQCYCYIDRQDQQWNRVKNIEK